MCIVQLLATVAACVSVAFTYKVEAQTSPALLLARGLVIEDDQGRARVIVGAPLPEVRERNRKRSLDQHSRLE
jgi:hypothetical protein